MREIGYQEIVDAVARLSMEANYYLGQDLLAALRRAQEQEEPPLGREVLDQILENARVAAEERMPLCQDTVTRASAGVMRKGISASRWWKTLSRRG